MCSTFVSLRVDVCVLCVFIDFSANTAQSNTCNATDVAYIDAGEKMRARRSWFTRMRSNRKTKRTYLHTADSRVLTVARSYMDRVCACVCM